MEYKQFETSVTELMHTLPQWDMNEPKRVLVSMLSSLFEEAGEISGLISKFRVRKNYGVTDYRQLDNFKEIREKFIDEVGDFLWVLVCSIRCIFNDKSAPNFVDIESLLDKDHFVAESLEFAHFCLISDISALHQTLCFNDNELNSDTVAFAFEDIIDSFNTVLYFLGEDYDISVNDLYVHNVEKLNNRYNKKGANAENGDK